MDLQVAEPACEGDVLLRRQRLVPEEDDLVVVERPAQLGDDLVRQLRAEVDARDLGPHRRTEPAGVEGTPPQRGQAVPLRRHVGEGPDGDRVPGQLEGTRGGPGGRRRRHVGTVPA